MAQAAVKYSPLGYRAVGLDRIIANVAVGDDPAGRIPKATLLCAIDEHLDLAIYRPQRDDIVFGCSAEQQSGLGTIGGIGDQLNSRQSHSLRYEGTGAIVLI